MSDFGIEHFSIFLTIEWWNNNFISLWHQEVSPALRKWLFYVKIPIVETGWRIKSAFTVKTTVDLIIAARWLEVAFIYFWIILSGFSKISDQPHFSGCKSSGVVLLYVWKISVLVHIFLWNIWLWFHLTSERQN